MCKTCGCASGGTKQIEVHIQECDGLVRDDLKKMLIGLPGVLHVQPPGNDNPWIIDFDPRHSSKGAIEDEVKKVANITAITEYQHHFHWNFITSAKIPRMARTLQKYLSRS